MNQCYIPPMRLVIIVLCLAVLTACESAVDREQRKLDMMKKAGASAAEICQQHRKLVAAKLDQGNQDDYEREQVSASVDCMTEQLDR